MMTKSPRNLPTVNGYTVDVRLREFRKVRWNSGEPSIEFVPFACKKGNELLSQLES